MLGSAVLDGECCRTSLFGEDCFVCILNGGGSRSITITVHQGWQWLMSCGQCLSASFPRPQDCLVEFCILQRCALSSEHCAVQAGTAFQPAWLLLCQRRRRDPNKSPPAINSASANCPGLGFVLMCRCQELAKSAQLQACGASAVGSSNTA